MNNSMVPILSYFQELPTKAQYCERLLSVGINCGTQSFLISVPRLDQYSSDSLDLRPMLEPALTKSLVLSTDQKKMVEQHLIDQNMTKKCEIIEHIYNVIRQFHTTQREFQRMINDGNVRFIWKNCQVSFLYLKKCSFFAE